MLRVGITLGIVLIAGAARALDPVPLGPEFQVNTGQTERIRYSSDLAPGADGGFVVTWEGGTSEQCPIYVRTFDADGAPTSGNVRVNGVNPSSADCSFYPAVSSDPGGNFVVVWNQNYPDYRIEARRGDATATLQGTPFTVSSICCYTYSNDVANSPDGEFVVAWTDSDGYYPDVSARRFDASGVPTGSQIPVRAGNTPRGYSHSSVATDGAGNFVVVWAEYDGDTDRWRLAAQRYDAADAPVGAEIAVTTDGYERFSSAHQNHGVAMDSAGNFVVVWERETESGVMARRFDASGAPLGEAFECAVQGQDPRVALEASGDFVVVWEADGSDILGRHFSASIGQLGPIFPVHVPASARAKEPAVTLSGDGFVVTWEQFYDLPYGVFGRRFARPADFGIAGAKLVMVERPGKAKTVYVSKADPAIAHGAAGDPALLSGRFEVFYTDASSVAGSFGLPAPWQTDSTTVAKYVNTLAPGGVGHVKVAVVKDGLKAKVRAKGLGDGPTFDLFAGPPSASGGVTTVLTVINGNDASGRRMCTKFATDAGSTVAYSVIAAGAGRKLVATNGVPTACP